jgi:hypothetical protein
VVSGVVRRARRTWSSRGMFELEQALAIWYSMAADEFVLGVDVGE